MTSLLALSGSPSADSRTAALAGHMVQRLTRLGYQVGHVRVRDLPPADLLAGRADSPALRPAVTELAAAAGVVVATPVYQGAYSGLLKAFLDLLPQKGLAGKAVLPLMTGGSTAHALAIDYALRPVLTSLGARHVVCGAFVLDTAVQRGEDGEPRLRADARARLDQVLGEFVAALESQSVAGDTVRGCRPRTLTGVMPDGG